MKAPLRSKSIGTKVTTEEYARLEACAAASRRSLSEWSREALLEATEKSVASTGEQTMLAELLGLRTILLNVFFRLGQGEMVAPEEMRGIIERADAGKLEKAVAKLQNGCRLPEKERAAAGVAG